MEKRFSANIPAITAEEQALLRKKHVLVAGCGGIGNYVIEYLARAGVGRITAVDSDVFEESNLNRQLYATAATLGKNKVTAAAERVREIAPGTAFDFWLSRLRGSTAPSALRGKDLVLDALDSIEDRLMLEEACGEAGLCLVHGAVAGWLAQAMTVSPGSGSLRTFYENNAAPATHAVLSFAPALCAAVQAAEALKLLCGRAPSLEDKLLCFDCRDMTARTVLPAEHVFAEGQIDVTICKYDQLEQRDVYTVPERTTVRQILKILSLEGENLYVMRNGQYVMPEDFDRPVLEAGDLLELRKSAAFGG